ncbi:hypothetical protein ACSBR2_041411 [Camellia fascicularis]
MGWGLGGLIVRYRSDEHIRMLYSIHMAMPVLVSLDNKQSMRVDALLLLGVLSLVLCLLVSICSAELQRFEHPPSKGDGSVSFLVLGDWGRRGAFNQSQVALQMGVVGEKLGIDFVVSASDDLYYILSKRRFLTPKGDTEAQLKPLLRQIASRWLCLRSFVVNATIANSCFIDTNPFVNKYFQSPKNHTYDWRGVSRRDKYISNLLKEYKVDMYMNGHDHCLEHIGYAKR